MANKSLVLVLLGLLASTRAFVPRHPMGRHPTGLGSGGNHGADPPHNWNRHHSNDDVPRNMMLFAAANQDDEDDDKGGLGGNLVASSAKSTSKKSATTKSSGGSTSLGAKLTQPFRNTSRAIRKRLRSKKQRAEDEQMERLRTTAVRQVKVPQSTVLPNNVVQIAARRAGVVGNPLRMDRIQDFARILRQWYTRQGFVLHTVTGATLVPDTATAEIQVEEPKSSKEPISIVFCRELVVDPETGEAMTFRQYAERHTKRRTLGFNVDKARADLNRTYIPIREGRTRPDRLASAMGMAPGKDFVWNEGRWQNIVRSGIFKQVLQVTPKAGSDGNVQMQIVASEAAPRHLEYGLAKSLYTGGWEGEIDFEHINLLGGGETLSFTLRQGTKGPSSRLMFSDSRFGLEGGYDVELFSDYLDHDVVATPTPPTVSTDETDTSSSATKPKRSFKPFPFDWLGHRTGATFRLRNPIDRKLLSRSVGTASVEKVFAPGGQEENIASTTLGVGPFTRDLPLGARSNVDARILLGSRFPASEKSSFAPFSSLTATTRQTFPLVSGSSSSTRPIVLALKHSLTASTESLPLYETQAQAIACKIRGPRKLTSVGSSLSGTTEIRIPIRIPMKQLQQDASVVLFGDWLFARSDSQYVRQSSIGLGLRKGLQGIPLKVNFCYVRGEGKIRSTIELGRDFDV